VAGVDPVTRFALALGLGVLTGADLPGADAAWGCLALGLLLIALPHQGLGGVRGLLLALVVGIGCARTVPMGPELQGTVQILGVRTGGSVGRTGDVRIWRAWQPGRGWSEASGPVRVSFPADPPPPGTPVLLLGRAGPIRGALPGAPDPVRAARLAGVRTQVRAERAQRLDGDPQPLIDPERDPTGLLRAIVLGDRSGCSPETLAVLRRTGTSHLLSISGFHVGVASAMAMGIVSALTRSVALLRPSGLRTPLSVIAGIGAAWAYTALAGFVVPAERAAALLTVGLLARAGRRGVHPVPALTLIGVALALTEPGSPATASFQLSFGAMAGLILFVPRLTDALPQRLWGPLRWVASGLATTLGATLGTLPVAAWWFQEVAPLSPVANLVAMPVLGVALVPLGAVVCAAPEPLSQLAAWVGTLGCELELVVLRWLAVEPLRPALGPAGAVGLGLVVLLSLRWPKTALLLALPLLCAPRRAPAELRWTVLDVGQGDAMLVERADGTRWLVDGGRPGPAVAQWLRRVGIRRLDVVVCTHPDLDHSGGLPLVLDTIEVGELWAHSPPPELLAAAERRGVPVRAPPGALHPPPGALALDDNDRSIVLGVGPFLLAGDLEAKGEALLVPSLQGQTFPVLKVGHHGSRTSTTDALLEAVRPRLAVVSVGSNPYGHPHPAVLQRLADRRIEVLRTDLEGTITFELRGDHLEVWTHSGRRGHIPLRTGPAPPSRGGPSASAPRRRRPPARTPRRPRSSPATRSGSGRAARAGTSPCRCPRGRSPARAAPRRTAPGTAGRPARRSGGTGRTGWSAGRSPAGPPPRTAAPGARAPPRAPAGGRGGR
jgi:competence protein ComEC